MAGGMPTIRLFESVAFFLAARRSGLRFSQSGNSIMGKVMQNARMILLWLFGHGLCNQFAEFCIVFGV
jgi:hypothetical protein